MTRLTVQRSFRVGGAVLVALLLTARVAAAGAWSVVPSPSPSATANELNAVAVVAATDVWAMGDSTAASGASHTLIEHWNGTSWSVVPSPNPSASHNVLNAVAAVSARDVWAVGQANSAREVPQTLIEHWDGTRWSVVPGVNVAPGATFLNGVAAAAATDVWAVGQAANATSGVLQTLIEHWDGTTWSIVPSPNVGTHANVLTGVTAIASNTANAGAEAWAVGDFLDRTAATHTLIEHWNGTAWSLVSSPISATVPNVLNAVQAVSADDVWAVGQVSTQPLVEHWNGTSWSVVPSATPSTPNSLLKGIAIVAATDIWAVGFDVVNGLTLIEHWDGTRWCIIPSPNPGPTLNFLHGAAADRGSGQAWAVGVFFNASGVSQTLTEFHP